MTLKESMFPVILVDSCGDRGILVSPRAPLGASGLEWGRFSGTPDRRFSRGGRRSPHSLVGTALLESTAVTT